MKKLLSLFAILVLSLVVLAGCTSDKVLENTEKEYWVTGQWAGWGEAVGKTEFKMTATSLKDAKLASIKSQLKGATELYVIDVTFPTESAGWEVTDGVDGNLAIKVIRTAKADEDKAPEWWAQSPESGEVKNLTPDTLVIPEFVEATWNNNPYVKAAGAYTIVLARINNTLYMGAIAK